MGQVFGRVGHEPEQSLVLVHQGILFLGVEGIGKRIPAVTDPVVQEQGLVGDGVGEQSTPEGRGMEENPRGRRCFSAWSRRAGAKPG